MVFAAAFAVLLRAVAIAWICSGLREERELMPPVPLLMAVWIRAALAPFLFELAKVPWHTAQLLA